MRRLVNDAMDAVVCLNEDGLNRTGAAEAMVWVGKYLVFAFIFTALYFKHPAYKHEGEYRYFVMTLPDNPIPGRKTRKGRHGRSIDYYELDWKRRYAHALKLVQIGPAMSEDGGRLVAKRALKRSKLSALISMSDIPAIDR